MSLRIRKNKAVIPPACPIDVGVKLLAGAWAPHVIWFLSQQPRRFGELRKDIPAISARVLSARLRDLETRGVIVRHPLATSPPSTEYALTELGRELIPALTALVEVARKMESSPPSERHTRSPSRSAAQV
jgi:DNA-binding HxlR family transcriptional regulator